MSESSPLLEAPGLPVFSAAGIPYESEDANVPLSVAEPIDDYGSHRNYSYNSWHPSNEYNLRQPNVIYRRSEEEFFWWYCLCLFFWLLVLIVVIASISTAYDDDDYMR